MCGYAISISLRFSMASINERTISFFVSLTEYRSVLYMTFRSIEDWESDTSMLGFGMLIAELLSAVLSISIFSCTDCFTNPRLSLFVASCIRSIASCHERLSAKVAGRLFLMNFFMAFFAMLSSISAAFFQLLSYVRLTVMSSV